MDALRFDAFARSVAAQASRRRLLKGLAVLGLGGVLARPTALPTAAKTVKCTAKDKACDGGQCRICEFYENGGCTCWCDKCQHGGIIGGGSIRAEDGGEAQVVLIATRKESADNPGAYVVQGKVSWVDPTWEGTGLVLESTDVSFYAPLPEI